MKRYGVRLPLKDGVKTDIGIFFVVALLIALLLLISPSCKDNDEVVKINPKMKVTRIYIVNSAFSIYVLRDKTINKCFIIFGSRGGSHPISCKTTLDDVPNPSRPNL